MPYITFLSSIDFMIFLLYLFLILCFIKLLRMTKTNIKVTINKIEVRTRNN